MDTILIILYLLLGFLSTAGFVVWLVFKIKVANAGSRIGRKSVYISTVKSVKALKPSKILFSIALILLGLAGTALFFGIVLSLIALLAIIFTLGGAMFIDAGGDPTGYNNLIHLTGAYWRIFLYWGYSIYIILILFFARNTYVNIISRNRLLQMETISIDDIPKSDAIKPTSKRVKKALIIAGSIILGFVLWLTIYHFFDFDIVGDLLLELL